MTAWLIQWLFIIGGAGWAFSVRIMPWITAKIEFWGRSRGTRISVRVLAGGGVLLVVQQLSFWWLVLLALAAVVALAGWLVLRYRSRSISRRWLDYLNRTDGLATMWAIFRRSSAFMMRWRLLRIVRPSMAEFTLWQRLRVSAYEFAIPMARVGIQRIWASLEDVVAVIGAPRTGKSGQAGVWVLTCPGSLVAPSTRIDLYKFTWRIRALFGPVYIFNPGLVGGLASTITFDPLVGCEVPKVAKQRAEDMLGAGPGGRNDEDRKFWLGWARSMFSLYLHAAAISGGTMLDVQRWIATPELFKGELRSHLHASPEPTLRTTLDGFLALNDKTQTSISASIAPAVEYLSDPPAKAASRPGGITLDVERFLRERATIYLIGAEKTHTASLIGGLAGAIAEAARAQAELDGGRIDPPLRLVLDEAAQFSFPLPSWTADMGGRGVQLCLVLQSWAQLESRYGKSGAAEILNNIATLMVFGRVRDEDDLNRWARLAGDRLQHRTTRDDKGAVTSSSEAPVPVIPSARLVSMPPWHVLVIAANMAPAIGRSSRYWKHRMYKRHGHTAPVRTRPVRRVLHRVVRTKPRVHTGSRP